MVPSETVRGRSLVSLVRTAYMLGYGTLVAANLVRRLKPAAVVGFGGYPTLPPLMAARLLGVPGIIHDANAVLGRANRFLSTPRQCDRHLAAGRARSRSCARGQGDDRRHADAPGHPHGRRRAVLRRPSRTVPLRLLVVGGSQGARVMSDIVPGAIEKLEPIAVEPAGADAAGARGRHGRGCARSMTGCKINAELAPFFTDLPARLASSHLVISRSGAGTVAELAAIGRPSILVPLPGAIDQDQFANAGVLAQADGALADSAGRIHARPAGRRNLGALPPSRRG